MPVLADLGEYGVLDTTLCHELHFKDFSREWCRQKLAQYRNAGLTESVKLQVWFADESADEGGRIPSLHFLTESGAQVVQQWTGCWPRRVLRSDPSPATLFHRLQVVKVRVAFDLAAKAAGLSRPIWTMEQDVRPDASNDLMPNQRKWLYHEYRVDRRVITCQPDAASVLQIPNPERPEPTSLAGLYEVDLSHEGLEQIGRKMPGYDAVLKNRKFPYWAHFNNPTVRVFWVVRSEERIRHIVAEVRNHEAAKLFRFTTFEHCDTGVLTQMVWKDIDANLLAIYQPHDKNHPAS